MIYDIKAIPTTYAGVNFRSRLEARWAVFFDLSSFKWEYEPFDLNGWAPDFLLRLKLCNVLCEVKWTDLTRHATESIEKYLRDESCAVDAPEYGKAIYHAAKYQVLLLGGSPIVTNIPMPIGFSATPPNGSSYSHDDVIDALSVDNSEDKWREAGNIVQWQAKREAA